MNIKQAAIKYTNERNTSELFKLLDKMEESGLYPTHLPLICDVNRCGEEGHKFAWDTLEDWLDS